MSALSLGLEGKRALVTGSSRGIGKAIAVELAARGALTIVHGLEPSSELDSAVAEVQRHGDVRVVHGDLTRADQISSLMESIEKQTDGIDILINNAAAQNRSPILDLLVEDWDHVMAVNLRAPFICAQHAARLMIAKGNGGKILNISSVHAQQPRRHYAHYSCAKAGLDQLTRCLALELAEHRIQVNSVILGAVATDLTPDDRQAIFASAIPMGRVASPEEVGRMVAILCSDTCNYVTGSSITFDGGLTLGFCASRKEL